MELKLNQAEIKELNDFIQDLPTKYGLPLLNYLNKKIQEQNQPTAEETTVVSE